MPQTLRTTPRPVAAGTPVQRPPRPAAPAAAETVARPRGWTPRPSRAPALGADGFRAAAGTSAPAEVDGTPLYRQTDPAWGRRVLGKTAHLSTAGCALTSTAMAIGKISGKPIDPGELDGYLDAHRGYTGDSLDWNKAAAARGLKVNKDPWSLATIDRNLAAGRPVVIGVDYKPGSGGGANGTDHWICLTRKDQDEKGRTYYAANDPGTGKSIRLYPDAKGKLNGDGAGALGRYRTTNLMRTFSEA